MGIPFPIPTVRTKSWILAIWLHMNVFAAERLRLIGNCFATKKMQEDYTMARPKKDESIRRTNNVMVRFTDVEYALVSCSAEQAGYPIAVYVRKQAITEKLHVHYNIVADIAELRDFARQLSHIGNNLNQIAAFFNSGGIQSRAMLEEINRCMTDLRAMRKEIAGLAGDYRGNLKTRRG